jgi:hypothetical protein
MTERYFHLKLQCTYKGTENEIEDLTIEVLNDNEWEELNLDIRSPGFLLFINGLFSCQHLYMRTNSAERNLVLESAAGDMKVLAGEYWEIKDTTIAFKVKLKSGLPTEDDISYITDRMKHCPVSTNLPESLQIKTSVHFDK